MDLYNLRNNMRSRYFSMWEYLNNGFEIFKMFVKKHPLLVFSHFVFSTVMVLFITFPFTEQAIKMYEFTKKINNEKIFLIVGIMLGINGFSSENIDNNAKMKQSVIAATYTYPDGKNSFWDDILAQQTYNDMLYYCVEKNKEISVNGDYEFEIRNESREDVEKFIKNYVDYKIGSDNEEVFKIERKAVLRRLKRDVRFRLENSRRYWFYFAVLSKNYNYFKKYVKIIYLMLFLFDRI